MLKKPSVSQDAKCVPRDKLTYLSMSLCDVSARYSLVRVPLSESERSRHDKHTLNRVGYDRKPTLLGTLHWSFVAFDSIDDMFSTDPCSSPI